ncbi:hypothetical protein VOLCADRAFT_96625 [Volvox carteri f. nagariensis]|uniref:S-adenosyl-L-methionine-dependent methyltransferase n=1 Tax=Volvox carteri f. nagariensis TaxID=3068 RepID=D8UAL6_VOLCA|nr:uncharacterized protein VOLCADRAFT_96625 [Volvox carteri f. nagariensis]EFJ43282.1 hypothetical protein VOLCADRAFT_96625 [Volvox carteri f. nagariensis]|eukprot:XP_002955642.1 hypothetical protein VOLCADRAFT_96625 [Volvox carteri f. nagariensis]
MAWNQMTWVGRTRRTTCLARAQQHAVPHPGADMLSAATTQRLPQQPALPPPSLLPLHVSQRIAAARAVESRRHRRRDTRNGDDGDGPPLFVDPYADLLANWRFHEVADQMDATARQRWQRHQLRTALDVIATAHLDRLLLNATSVSAVNRITQGDYRQVVLLGDGMDTRPYRLPLAPGTAIFLVAPAAVHAAATAALASEEAAAVADAVAADGATTTSGGGGGIAGAASWAADSAGGGNEAGFVGGGGGEGEKPVKLRNRQHRPRPPPGCLLRRVPLELQPGTDFSSLTPSLEAAGFRTDRLSVWVVQGLSGLRLRYQDVVSLLAEAAHGAAYHSLLMGELPYMSYNQAANALADCGLLGAPLAFGTPESDYGRWREGWSPGTDGDVDVDGGCTATAAADQATQKEAGAAGRGARAGAGAGAGSETPVEAAAGAEAEAGAPQRWLFAAQQIRLSAAQMDVYAAHRTAAEETDEDFFDNFS